MTAATRAHTDAVLTLQAGLAQWTADLDAMLDVTERPPLDWDGRVFDDHLRDPPALGQQSAEIVGVLEPGFELLWPKASNIQTHPDVYSAMRIDLRISSR